MGKRELGLILAFAVVGIVVWQVTAPKAEGPGFSVSNWLGAVRREIHGRRASAELTTTPAIPMDASIHELRVTLSGEITITGEDRQDVAAELRVVSNGFDDAEAKKLAGETALTVSKFADSVVLAWKFPEPGSQQPRLTLKVPKRLRIQLEGRGSADVSGVSSITLARPAGALKLANVAGPLKGEYRGGDLTIDGAQTVDLSTVGGESVIKGVLGDIRISARGGEVRLDKTTGRVTITGTDTRIRVDGTTGDLRAEMVEGDLELNDVGGAIDIDARATAVQVGWTRAATAKIQVRNGDLEIDLPNDSATYSLDARAAGGELRVPDSLQKKTEGEESAVIKTAGANAPSIFVRGVGASITIR